MPARQQIRHPLASTLLGVTLLVAAASAAAQTSTPVVKAPVASPKTPVTTQAGDLDWQHLSAAQRQALRPLAQSWPRLTELQKKKWIALSANFHTLTAPAKERLHARMAEWAALTPKQRTQARFNYSQTQTLPNEDKAERWEIYQSLTAEQKKALAASAAKVPLAPHVKVPKAPAY